MIPVALTGALFLSLGAQFQSRGVRAVEDRLGRQSRALGVRNLLRLLSNRSWMLGTLMLGLAVVLQLVSITFARLVVVQPLGAVALVFTTWFSARSSGVALGRQARRAVWACIAGVTTFVGIAAIVGHEGAIHRQQLVTVLVILAAVLCLVLIAVRIGVHRGAALFCVVIAGVLYGFVATLAKVTLSRLVNGVFDWLSVLTIIGVVVAASLGGYFVQNAYAHGPADLVVAGLTVIDPIVAVGIGIAVLGEAVGTPALAIAGFVVAAIIAIAGVFLLAENHPHARN
jgi:drug/metabolite transporter (DMT)-like permease